MAGNTITDLKTISPKTTGNKNIEFSEIPVDAYLIEAMELYKWCQDDKKILLNAGIDWNIVNSIPSLVYCLQDAESRWFTDRFKTFYIVNKWKSASRHGYELRNTILHAMEYAYRHRPDLMAEIISLKNEGNSSDLIQNLKDISAFGKRNSNLLNQINYDIHLLDEAAEFAEILNEILNIAKSGDNSSNIKHERDEVCMLLKNAVDEIRACGQYVFWRDAERLRGYKYSQNSIKSQYYYNYQIKKAN